MPQLNSICLCMVSFCRIGEGRACWSLGNAYTALGNHDQAMHFAEKHLEICREVCTAHTIFTAKHFRSTQSKLVKNRYRNPSAVKLTVGLFLLFFCCCCFQTGDRSGELTARMNVSDLQTLLGLSYSTNTSTVSENKDIDYSLHGKNCVTFPMPLAIIFQMLWMCRLRNIVIVLQEPGPGWANDTAWRTWSWWSSLQTK